MYFRASVSPNRSALPRFLRAAFCSVVLLQLALSPGNALRANPDRVVIAAAADDGAHDLALKHPDGLLLAAAMEAISRSSLPLAQLQSPDSDPHIRVLPTAWRYGASFSRNYTRPRLHRILVPPSTNDPDA